MPSPFAQPRLHSLAGSFAIAAALLVGSAAGAAEPFPSRPLTMIVPFPAGGTTDIFARAIAQGMSQQLRQTVIVDNKAGAGGTVGAAHVMRSQPDGYTMLMGGPSDQVNAPFLSARPTYDPARDFEPVGCAVRAPNVLVINPKVPAQSLTELIRLAKTEPGKLNFASAGVGNTSHLLGELFGQSAGIKITHVPYRGNAPALTDLLGGQVQMMFSSPIAVLQYIKRGTLRAVAVTSGARLRELPDVPTLRESGIPVEVYSWACVLVPAKTPSAIVDKLHEALARTLEDPAVVQAIESTGGGKFSSTREESRRFLATERSTWGNLIRARNIHAD